MNQAHDPSCTNQPLPVDADPPAPFIKPSPGTWTLDASHCERPLPRFMVDLFDTCFTTGNRAAAEDFGALIDTVEASSVNGFIYTCVRPLGGPPEPKGPPPKLLLKLMMLVHPGIRRRLRAADAVFSTKRWREDTRRYLETDVPAIVARAAPLRDTKLDTLDDRALARHIGEVHDLVRDDLMVHYGINFARIVPVGDLIAHVQAWVDVRAQDVLAALQGFSPSSVEGLAELESLADHIRNDRELTTRLASEVDPEALINGLESSEAAVGDLTRHWLDIVAHRVTGFSPGYPTLRETPSTLVAALRAAIDGGDQQEDALANGKRQGDLLREKVPAAHRGTFDSLLEEARSVYFIRDHCTMRDTLLLGMLRRSLLELGRRLAERGLLDCADAGLDLTPDEVQAALVGDGQFDRERVHHWNQWRHRATSDRAPEVLGPPPEVPPPADWFPPGQARLIRAIDAYVDAMFGELDMPDPDTSQGEAEARNQPALVVRGLSASPGKREGTARLVLDPGDFDRVEPGDVLVARITTPSYNVLLPMLAGIVTDRGGALSHPAIVSREYGIPGVVGCRVATTTIPDGARVEVDGDAGTIRILS